MIDFKSFLLPILCTLLFLGACGDEGSKQFVSLPAEYTGIEFNNEIDDTDSLHIMNFEYIYNGGGVAIGDFNQDELQDVFFTGNMVSNALYLNQGNLKFKDISQVSGIAQHDRWSSGVTVVDINLDGLLDIYVCSTGHDLTSDKSNLLFINKGVNEEGIPIFEEMAVAYGIEENSNSTQAVFFDYDNDEDLDLFIIANEMPEDRSPSRYREKVLDGSSNTTDHLYKNEWNEAVGHPVFVEVGKEAGILVEGYSLGVNVCDINNDGWQDVFVSNDYLSNDIFYINNQDGTFTDKADQMFKHTSFSSMGTDIVDLDNDGDSDVIAVDMLPEDNYRRKTMLSPNKYSDNINNDRYGFTYQHVRNTLQLNNSQNGNIGDDEVFSDVAFMAGVAATDWSWTPLVADFDNDGDRDMIITNGFPKDITDRDFINYSTTVKRFAEEQFILQKVPAVKLLNYAYRNDDNLNFTKVSSAWGIENPSFSNGAAYADLDNDGDLDYIVNNINDPASVYENQGSTNNWIEVELNGFSANPKGIGAEVHLYSGGTHQVYTNQPTRGYLSSHELIAHFGLGSAMKADSIIVEWGPKNKSKIIDVDANQKITIGSNSSMPFTKSNKSSKELFKEISDSLGLVYVHEEQDVIDFNSQPLLLHKLSQYGPALSVGDLTGDGLDDLYISGAAGNKGTIYEQQANGSFAISDRLQYASDTQFESEELGAIIFDADNDGDNDLYVVSGSNEYIPDSEKYHDIFFLNDGGQLNATAGIVPEIKSSGLAVKAADYDGDGYIDLFIGGRLTPGQYPTAGKSYILRNMRGNGKVGFENVTERIAPGLDSVGMITDAQWTDFDNDNDLDLLLVGELMAVTAFVNDEGNFNKKIISPETGFWNSIVGGDIDNDGDTDYVLGNLGNNIVAGANDEHPIRIYYKDFDNNGLKDLIPTCYFPAQDGSMKEFTYHNSLDIAKQFNAIKKRFILHGEYAKATMQEVFSEEELDNCEIYAVNHLESSVLINDGSGSFTLSSMSDIVQRAPVYGMKLLDLNEDNFLDLLVVGNDYGQEVSVGRLDAHNGLVGIGNGDGTFNFETGHGNGFLVQEDAKALVSLNHKASNSQILIASQNQGKLKVYTLANKNISSVALSNDDVSASIEYENGSARKVEFHYGSGFLSQSGRQLTITDAVKSIKIINTKGEEREITF